MCSCPSKTPFTRFTSSPKTSRICEASRTLPGFWPVFNERFAYLAASGFFRGVLSRQLLREDVEGRALKLTAEAAAMKEVRLKEACS